jgi:hypothetical protein
MVMAPATASQSTTLFTLTTNKAQRVRTAHAGLVRYLNQHSAQCPITFRESRTPAIAALLANSCWWMTTPAREVVADVGLAIFAFDDLVDEEDIEVEDLEFRCEQLLAQSRGEPCPEVGFDPTAGLLLDVAERLAASPFAELFWPDWVDEFGRCFRAIVAHRRVAMGEAQPSLDAYLDMGRDSVGIAAVCVAAAMVGGDARVVAHRDAYLAAAGHAAVAARIANDLRSINRELNEQTTNVLMLDGSDVATLELRVKAERAAAARILADIDAGWPGQFVLTFLDGLLALYGCGDFHDGRGVEGLQRAS